MAAARLWSYGAVVALLLAIAGVADVRACCPACSTGCYKCVTTCPYGYATADALATLLHNTTLTATPLAFTTNTFTSTFTKILSCNWVLSKAEATAIGKVFVEFNKNYPVQLMLALANAKAAAVGNQAYTTTMTSVAMEVTDKRIEGMLMSMSKSFSATTGR
jgi:predicted alternative tryptophan synthase beta-subunit